jgi:hypothetical protein
MLLLFEKQKKKKSIHNNQIRLNTACKVQPIFR